MSSGPDAREIVSEINPFLVSAPVTVQPLLKSSHKVAQLSFSLLKPQMKVGESGLQENTTQKTSPGVLNVDEDGDLILARKPTDTNVMECSLYIEYENATNMKMVGMQVWRGAFLLADFILYSETHFRGKRVLELGSGTGMSAIVAAMCASSVVATDLDDKSILSLIEVNAKHNCHLVRCPFTVLPFDFLSSNWSPELEKTVQESDTIMAADVIYSTAITPAFVSTLKKILFLPNSRQKDIFIALEQRFVFTIADLDTVAPMFAVFLDELEKQLHLEVSSPSGNSGGTVSTIQRDGIQVTLEKILTDFPQCFAYERTPQLVLLHLKSSKCQN